LPDLKGIREILEELAAEDDRTRDVFPKWLAELDRRKKPAKKPPASERAHVDAEDQSRTG
jgi:hypothetical protein